MIEVIIYHKKNELCGYRISGHAGFAKAGEDIVCSAVSILTINTVNAIEQLTSTPFSCKADEKKGGYLEVMFPKEIDHDATLLLKAMVLGLEDLAKEYKKYIRLYDKEV